MSPVAAGFIGMAVTMVVLLGLLGLLACLGLVAFGRKGRRNAGAGQGTGARGEKI